MEFSAFSPENREPDQPSVASTIQWGKEITRGLHTRTIDAAWAHQQYEANSESVAFDNELVSVCDSQLVLIGKTKAATFSQSPFPVVWFWQNRLYPTWTLSIFDWERGKTWRAFVANKSPEWALLRNMPVKILLLREDECVAALEVDLTSANPEFCSDNRSRARQPFDHLDDNLGGKVYAEAHAGSARSPEERLRNGWVLRLNREAGLAYTFLNDREHAAQLEEEKVRLSRVEFGAIFGGDNYLAKLYAFYHDRFWVHGDEPVAHSLRLQEDLQDCPFHRDAALLVLKCAWFSAKGTSGGQRIQSVDLDGGIRPVPIDAQAIGDRCKVFWDRFPFTLPLYLSRDYRHRELLSRYVLLRSKYASLRETTSRKARSTSTTFLQKRHP